MLLIETNSISNMGCQKFKIVRSSGYLTNTSFVCQVSFFVSAHLDNKQKSFSPKKLRHVTI
jgi:hypothetical protein